MTQLASVRKWKRSNKDWQSPEVLVLIELLESLAKTMDKEMEQKGSISSGVATAYRLAFQQVLALKPSNNNEGKSESEDLFFS